VPSMRGPHLAVAILACALLFVPACGGGDGLATPIVVGPVAVPETESNDTTATASVATLGIPSHGSLVEMGDVDVWSVALTASQDVEIEVFSTRRDPSVWDATGNRVIATLLAPDGTSVLATTEPAIGAGLDQDIARFRIAATGTHFLELRTAAPSLPGGLYAFTIRAVTFANLQSETEPNDTAATATSIVPGTVFGTRAPGEDDFYALTVVEPTIVRFETFAYRDGAFGTAAARFDPLLDLLDATGLNVLKTRDDGIFFDTVFAYRIDTPGTYPLRVKSFGGTGNAGTYYLRFDAWPVGAGSEVEPNQPAPSFASSIADGGVLAGSVVAGDDDYFAIDGTAGDEVHLQLLSLASDVQGATTLVEPVTAIVAANGVTVVPSSGPGPSQRIRRTILLTTGRHFVRVSTGSVTPIPYTLRLSIPSTSAFEVELNDAVGTANPIPDAGRISGNVDTLGDVDVYSFSAVAGELVVLSVLGSVADASNADLDGWGSTIVPRLAITDGAANLLASADDLAPSRKARGTIPGTHRVEVAFLAPSTGTFFAHVSDVGLTPTPHYTLVKR